MKKLIEIEDIINKLNHKTQKKFDISHKLGRSCYLLIDENSKDKMVLKFEPKVQNKLHSIWRWFFGGSLPFQNELRVLNTISTSEKKKFLNPKLFQNQFSSFYLMEYISNNELLPNHFFSDSIKINICSSLASFRKLNRPKKWNFFKECAFRILESPLRKMFKMAFYSYKLYKIDILKLLILILKLEITRILKRKIPPGFIHNDFGPNNIIIDSNSSIYFIDFEDALWEKKWPLVDITDIAIDEKTGMLDNQMIKTYLLQILKKRDDIWRLPLSCHLKFGYLRILLRRLCAGNPKDKEMSIYLQKINGLIENDNMIDNWYAEFELLK